MNTDEYRSELKSYLAARELDRYRYHAGLGPKPPPLSGYSHASYLFSHEAVTALRCELDQVPDAHETERAGLRSLLNIARLGLLELRLQADSDPTGEDHAEVVWNNRTLSLEEIPQVLSTLDRPRRIRLADLWAKTTASASHNNRERRLSRQRCLAQLGFNSGVDLFAEVAHVDLASLSASVASIPENTTSLYLDSLHSVVAQAIGDSTFEFIDYFAFRQLDHVARFFPDHRLLGCWQETLRGMNLDLERQHSVLLDTQPRPLKKTVPEAFRINPPTDVRLSLWPAAGVQTYRQTFESVAFAAHHACCSSKLAARNPEFIFAPDPALAEAYQILFALLLIDATWLIEFLPAVSDLQARKIMKANAVVVLQDIRQSCAQLQYDLTLDSPLPSDAEANYVELLSQATGFRFRPEFYLSEDQFQSANNLRATTFAFGLEEHLRTKFGTRWWRSSRAGDELRDLWNTASRHHVEELARLIGFGDVTLELAVARLSHTIAGE